MPEAQSNKIVRTKHDLALTGESANRRNTRGRTKTRSRSWGSPKGILGVLGWLLGGVSLSKSWGSESLHPKPKFFNRDFGKSGGGPGVVLGRPGEALRQPQGFLGSSWGPQISTGKTTAFAHRNIFVEGVLSWGNSRGVLGSAGVILSLDSPGIVVVVLAFPRRPISHSNMHLSCSQSTLQN